MEMTALLYPEGHTPELVREPLTEDIEIPNVFAKQNEEDPN